jgi:hypothetical protein
MTPENKYRLKKLYLSDTKLTDVGLESIKELTGLLDAYTGGFFSKASSHVARSLISCSICKMGICTVWTGVRSCAISSPIRQ